MWAWVRAAGRTPRPAVQVRKAWAWMKRLLAYWQAVVRSGPAAALARIAGELVPQPELAQQPQVRVPGQAVQPPVQPHPNSRSCLSTAGSTPQSTSRSRR